MSSQCIYRAKEWPAGCLTLLLGLHCSQEWNTLDQQVNWRMCLESAQALKCIYSVLRLCGLQQSRWHRTL